MAVQRRDHGEDPALGGPEHLYRCTVRYAEDLFTFERVFVVQAATSDAAEETAVDLAHNDSPRIYLTDQEGFGGGDWECTESADGYMEVEATAVELDTASSASRQHYIDTGKYLPVGEVAE